MSLTTLKKPNLFRHFFKVLCSAFFDFRRLYRVPPPPRHPPRTLPGGIQLLDPVLPRGDDPGIHGLRLDLGVSLTTQRRQWWLPSCVSACFSLSGPLSVLEPLGRGPHVRRPSFGGGLTTPFKGRFKGRGKPVPFWHAKLQIPVAF